MPIESSNTSDTPPVRPVPATAATSYVLVTPVCNEAATISRTISSVCSQTILPSEWVVVDDGSTDATPALLAAATRACAWIRVLRMPERPGRSFARVVENTLGGIAHLQTREYAYLGLLDADISFQPDYYERLLGEFAANPRLGLAGGVAIDLGLPRDRLPRNRRDVPGALQFFRRECFEAIGGLLPIPEGGWDAMTCVMARMRGYETRLVTDLVVDHLKPRNIAHGGAVRRKWQMGVRDYALGYHPLFELAKCFGRLGDRPWVIGATAWLLGFASARISRPPRIVPWDVIVYSRTEQRNRLRSSAFRSAQDQA